MYNRGCKHQERREGTGPITARQPGSRSQGANASPREIGDDAGCRRPRIVSPLFSRADEGLCVVAMFGFLLPERGA
jgi:hypothetical protein